MISASRTQNTLTMGQQVSSPRCVLRRPAEKCADRAHFDVCGLQSLAYPEVDT